MRNFFFYFILKINRSVVRIDNELNTKDKREKWGQNS